MRKLTESQKELLETHLKKKRIRYVELYDEVYDHYASCYESGSDSLEDVFQLLDQNFSQQYIDDTENKLTKKIFKSIKAIYKKELVKFFKWPQMVTSALFGLFLIILSYILPQNIFTFYILLPCILIPLGPNIYYFIREHQKLVPRNLKSGSLEAMNKVLILPNLILNTLLFLSYTSHENSDITAHPWILGILLLFVVCFNLITVGVYKQKIKYQFT